MRVPTRVKRFSLGNTLCHDMEEHMVDWFSNGETDIENAIDFQFLLKFVEFIA